MTYGSSGGPILSKDGEIIGVSSGYLSDSEQDEDPEKLFMFSDDMFELSYDKKAICRENNLNHSFNRNISISINNPVFQKVRSLMSDNLY